MIERMRRGIGNAGERLQLRLEPVLDAIQARLLESGATVWLELLATRDVWCAPVSSFDDLVEDPQVAHNGLLTTVPHPAGGDVRVVGMPVRFSATPGTIRSGPPSVGQHTDEILAERYAEDAR